MKDRGFATLGCLALAMSAACARHYVKIESRLVESSRDTSPEITATPQYFKAQHAIHKVALRAPDSCASQTAAAATGAAANQGSVVGTACGVEMAELERALSRAGYVVYSWKMIANMVGDAMHPSGVTAIAAAKHLGAQVVFQVNSLERVRVRPGQDARWERQFVESDSRGSNRAPIELADIDIQSLRSLVSDRETALLKRERLGAMLDANAIMVDTGQTVWFYRWIKAEPVREDDQTSVLARRDKGQWIAIEPEQSYEPKQTMVRSAEVEAVSTSGRSASEEEAVYFRLMRDVIGDFVAQFLKGSG